MMFSSEVGLNATPEYFDDRFHSFSDFVVMSVRPKVEEIGLLVYGIFKICRQLLGQGFTSRGGIAVGLLYHRDNADGHAGNSIAPSMFLVPLLLMPINLNLLMLMGQELFFKIKFGKLLMIIVQNLQAQNFVNFSKYI